MRRFEFADGSSNKFWQIKQDGANLRITYGKIGTNGQTQLKELKSDAAALAEHDKLVKEKTKKGYVEVTDAGAASQAGAPEPVAAEAPVAVDVPAETPIAAPAAEVSASGDPWIIPESIEVSSPYVPTLDVTFDDVLRDMQYSVPTFTKGRPRFDPLLKEATDTLFEALEKGALTRPLDVDTAALFCTFANNMERYIAKEYGFPFAVSVLLRAGQFQVRGDGGGSTVHVLTDPSKFSLAGGRLPGSLRSHFSAEDWEKGVAILAEARRTSSVFELRTQCNFIARNPQWGAEDAAEVVQFHHRDVVLSVLNSLEDLPTLQSIAKRFPSYVSESTLFQRFGLRAESMILEYFAKNLDYASQYTGVETIASAKLFALALSNKRGAEDARTFFEKRPDLAIVALAPIVAAGGKNAPFAKAPLATAIAARPDLPARLVAYLDAKTRAFLFAAKASKWPDAARNDLPADLQKLAPEGLPKKAAPLPDFVTDLPQIRLRGASIALPASAVEILVTSVRYSKTATVKSSDTLDKDGALVTDVVRTPAILLPGVLAAKTACEPKDLAAFAWSLFEKWQAADAPNKENWAFLALGFFGDDETARKLTPLIRAWPGESLHARATVGLDILAAIGTDVALMNLHGISQKLKFKALQEKAREKIAAVAAARGFSAEELADRLVPDFDLDEEGGNILDFGSRRFEISFDESLKPTLKSSEGGKLLTDLPKPNKSDDADKATFATDRWKALKKDAKAIAAGQILRLELAMCSERRWSPDVFRTFLVEHPVVSHLVRRLVWSVVDAKDGSIQSTFRVAEDGTFADDKDDSFTLEAGALVALPHRVALGEAQLAAWGQIFADYAILQPFDQLARAIYTLSAEDRGKNSLALLPGVEVKTGKILGLEVRGWRKSPAEDAGWVWSLWKPLRDGLIALLPLEGGICMGWSEGTPASQKIGPLSLTNGSHFGATAVPFGTLSKTAYSELVREMEGLV